MISKVITDPAKEWERTDEISGDTSFKDVKDTIADLKKVLNANKDAVAICAPQIGIDLRMFVVKRAQEEAAGESRYKVFLNPIIVAEKPEKHVSRETNLSFPNKEFIVFRPNELHVAYQEFDGRPNSESFAGAYAEVVSQMIQMLDGITLADIGLDLDDVGGPAAFDEASDKEKIELITMYADNLKAQGIAIQDEINSNEDLVSLEKSIKFMSEMLQGNIKPLDKDGNEVDIFKNLEENN